MIFTSTVKALKLWLWKHAYLRKSKGLKMKRSGIQGMNWQTPVFDFTIAQYPRSQTELQRGAGTMWQSYFVVVLINRRSKWSRCVRCKYHTTVLNSRLFIEAFPITQLNLVSRRLSQPAKPAGCQQGIESAVDEMHLSCICRRALRSQLHRQRTRKLFNRNSVVRICS